MKSVLRKFIRESLMAEAVSPATFMAQRRRGGEVDRDTAKDDSKPAFGTIGSWMAGASALFSSIGAYRQSRASDKTVKQSATAAWDKTKGKRKNILTATAAVGTLIYVGYQYFSDDSLSEDEKFAKSDAELQKFHNQLGEITARALSDSPNPRDEVRSRTIVEAANGADYNTLIAAHKTNYDSKANDLINTSDFSKYKEKFGTMSEFSKMITEIESLVEKSIPTSVPADERENAKLALLRYAHHFLVVATTVDILEDSAFTDLGRAVELVAKENKQETRDQITQNSDEIFKKIANSAIFKTASETVS